MLNSVIVHTAHLYQDLIQTNKNLATPENQQEVVEVVYLKFMILLDYMTSNYPSPSNNREEFEEQKNQTSYWAFGKGAKDLQEKRERLSHMFDLPSIVDATIIPAMVTSNLLTVENIRIGVPKQVLIDNKIINPWQNYMNQYEKLILPA